MVKVINSLEDLEKIKGEYIGEGREGRCYFLKDSSIVLKIYKDEEKPKELVGSNMKSSNIAFPIDIYVDLQDNIIGSTMPFMIGEHLENGFPENVEISKIKEAYTKLLSELQKFPNIYMSDLCLDNILYNEDTNSFYIIDTTLWKQCDDSFGLNYARLDQNLSHALYKNISWLNEYDFWKDDLDFASDFRRSKNEDLIYFLKFLDKVIEVVSKYFAKEIVTFGDLSSNIKKKS